MENSEFVGQDTMGVDSSTVDKILKATYAWLLAHRICEWVCRRYSSSN